MFLIDSRRSVLKDIEEDESSEDVADDINNSENQVDSSPRNESDNQHPNAKSDQDVSRISDLHVAQDTPLLNDQQNTHATIFICMTNFSLSIALYQLFV